MAWVNSIFRTIIVSVALLVVAGCESSEDEKELIMEITDIEFMELQDGSGDLKVIVRGNTNSSGWSEPELVQHVYIQPPVDGIYGFDFLALPPSDPVTQVVTPIQAEFIYDVVPEGFRGVNVVAKQNAMEATYESGDNELTTVYEVTDIRLGVLESLPLQLSIQASGKARTAGWTAPVLVPTAYSPQDGVYSYRFQAIPPDGMVAQVISNIEASLVLNPLPDDLVAVKIIAETNEMVTELDEPPSTEPPPKSGGAKEPVAEITAVELRLNNDRLTIYAEGQVNSSGWRDPELVPFNYLVPPAHGIYDFTFMAVPPSPDTVVTPALRPISVEKTVPLGDIKGVKVHARAGRFIKKMVPE